MCNPRYDTPVTAAEQTLAYKIVGDKRIHLTFLPPTTARFDRAPVYFIIPGGGWAQASRDAMLGFSQKSAAILRERGWAVVSIDYRVTPSDGVDLEGIVSDTFDAARYLAHFADVLAIDSRRILTSGHSAGGHLAMMLALAPHHGFTIDSPFDVLADDFAVVATAPLSAPIVLWRDAGAFCPQSIPLEGMGLFDTDDLSAQVALRHRVSPIDYVTPLSVPTLLVYGTHDDLVFQENSLRHHARCREVGAPCTLLASVFGGHCFEPMVEGKISTPNFEQVQDALVDFAVQFESSKII